MTEAEWLACDDSHGMLKELWQSASARKMRLFAVACCRSVWPQLTDPRGRRAVEVAEQFADGTASDEDRRRARLEVHRAVGAAIGRVLSTAVRAAYDATDPNAGFAATASVGGMTLGRIAGTPFQRPSHADLLRDIFGNPFRPVAFSPDWRTDTAVTLARQMYESRDFDAMPILADALQDAGCDSDDILNHCRGVAGGGSGEPAGGAPTQTTHVRGCWVVDLVLGKE
jgi:hypothetical protein